MSTSSGESRLENSRRSVTLRSESRWLTIPLAAHYSNTTPWYIRSLIWEGKVAFLKAGNRYLLDKADLDAYFEGLKGVAA